MFTSDQKHQIAAAVEAVLMAVDNPECRNRPIHFWLHVDGDEAWSWADITSNYYVGTDRDGPRFGRAAPEPGAGR